MSNKKPQAAGEPIIEREAEIPLTLNEFCIRLSVRDKRVELIGAFEFDERRAKRLTDTEKNYLYRYNKFLSKPA